MGEVPSRRHCAGPGAACADSVRPPTAPGDTVPAGASLAATAGGTARTTPSASMTGPAPSGPAPSGPAPSGPAPSGPAPPGPAPPGTASSSRRRSEEHTSELQSRGHLVCRLLLEKKKKQNVNNYNKIQKNYKEKQ